MLRIGFRQKYEYRLATGEAEGGRGTVSLFVSELKVY